MGYFRPLSQTKFINDANLVSYWKLDGNSNDSKGSNHGTDTNVTYNASYAVNSSFEQGALYNGTSSYTTINDNTSMELSSGTISIWWKPTSSISGTITRNYIIDKGDTYVGLRINTDSKLMFILYSDTGYYAYSSQSSWNAGQYYYITMTWGSGGQKLYVDGVLSGSNDYTGTYTNTTDNWTLMRQTGGTIYNNGQLDDIAIFSRALSAGEVAELYQSMTLGEYLPNSSTKLLLHLNGSSADSSGNNNNGTDTAITYSQANGKFGQGAGFNGSSSESIISDSSSISLTGNLAISVFVKPTSLPTSGNFMNLLGKYDVLNAGARNTGYEFRLYNDSGTQKIQFLFGAGLWGALALVSYSGTLPTTSWSHLLSTYNGTTVKLYLNGTEVATINYSTNPQDNTKSLYIGSFGQYTPTGTHLGRYFNGSIDEVIIENTAWSAEKIKKYYTNSKGRFGI